MLINSSPDDSRPSTTQCLGISVAACAATTLLATPLRDYLDLANIVMLFLLTVLIISVTLGRKAAVLASILSVLCFDVFFVPPRFSLAVSNIQYVVTFIVMLATALTTTHFTSVLRQRAREAFRRERRTQALYLLAKQLGGVITIEQVAEMTGRFTESQLTAASVVLVPGEQPSGLVAVNNPAHVHIEEHLAHIAMGAGKFVRSDEMTGMGYASLYFPLQASSQPRGVLAVAFEAMPDDAADEVIALMEALASLVAVAIERLHYADAARASDVKIMTERLRSSILSALSHDLRTPLTALVGLADSLFLVKPVLAPAALETAQAIHEQAARLAGLVGNLLDMARLNAGDVLLRREWQPLEEVVGSSIKLLGDALKRHTIKVSLEPELPLLEFDAVLIERVLCNLLENAAKYAPAGSIIELRAVSNAETAVISILDEGPGLPPHRHGELFKMFVRGQAESGQPGTGLGLAISKAIVEVHGGTITAENRPEGGAVVRFTLPLGHPPVVEEEVA